MNESSFLPSFLDYVGRFVPESKARIEPATPQEIARLTALVGHDLPPDYIEFLKLMGRSQGDALYEFNARLDVNNAIELYEETPPDHRPVDHVMIGSGLMAFYSTLALNRATGEVVDSDDDEILFTIAESLGHLLLQRAFLRYEFKRRDGQINLSLSGRKNTMADVRAQASNSGFSFAAFSDEFNLCGRLDEIRLAAWVFSANAGWIALSGGDTHRREEVARWFEKRLDVRRVRN